MAFTNSGYIIVDQDPNLETAIQGTQIPLLALLDDGVNPISRWSFDSNAVAGSKWTNMGTHHPSVSGGLVLPTFDSITHPLGYEFIVYSENGNLVSSHVSNGLAWSLVSERHPETISGIALPTWSSSTHKIGVVFRLLDSNGIIVESYISSASGWNRTYRVKNKVEIPSYAFIDPITPSIIELRNWIDLNLSSEDKNHSLLYLDLFKTYIQGNIITLSTVIPEDPSYSITKLTTTVNGLSTIKNVNINIRDLNANVYVPSDLIDVLSEELLSLGSKIGDLIITDNSYDGTNFVFEYANIGTEDSISISLRLDNFFNIDGALSTATISAGNPEEPSVIWDLNKNNITLVNKVETVDKSTIEIPDIAFADKANPTESEVRIWVDANLTANEKSNSQLYNIGGNTYREPTYTYFQTSSTFFLATATTAVLNSIDIEGTNYLVNLNLKDPVDSGIDAIMIASFADKGITVTTSNFSNSVNTYLRFTPSNGDTVINGAYNYTVDGTLLTKAFTNTPSLQVVELTSSGTEYKPDFKWNIIQDQIFLTSDYRDNQYFRGFAEGDFPVYDPLKHNEGLIWRADDTKASYIVKNGEFKEFGTEYSAIQANIEISENIINIEDSEFSAILTYSLLQDNANGDYLEAFWYKTSSALNIDTSDTSYFIGNNYRITDNDAYTIVNYVNVDGFTPKNVIDSLLFTNNRIRGTIGCKFSFVTEPEGNVDIRALISHKDINGVVKGSKEVVLKILNNDRLGDKTLLSVELPNTVMVKAPILTGAQKTASTLTDVKGHKGKIIYNDDTSNLEYWNGTAWVVLSIV